MTELGIGVVGYGFIGKVHTWAHSCLPFFYDPAPARTRLVGVCTSTPESGRKAQEQAGFTFATTDHAELLARPDIDVIHVCSPNDAHESLLLDAIRAGKHIYCDKPLTRTVAEAEKVAAAARATNDGKVRRMTFNYRFAPATLRAKELVSAGALGDIFQFRGIYLHSGNITASKPRTWRMDMSRAGGGALMDLGVHIFDLMRHLLGEFTEVNAQLVTRFPFRPDPKTGEPQPVDVDDAAIVQVQLASGAIGVLEASRLATGTQDDLRFEIHGSRGMLAFSLMDPNYLTFYDATLPGGALGGSRGPQRIECATQYPKPYALGGTVNSIGWPQLHVHCLYDFLSAAAGVTADSGPTFEDGLVAQRFVDACQRSSVGRAWVTPS